MTRPAPQTHRLRQAAAIVLWRPHGPAPAPRPDQHTMPAQRAIEVYLVQRAEHLAGFGGFWAFAGGSVDAEDAALPVSQAACPQAFIAAAARELFEETGVVAARAQALGEPGEAAAIEAAAGSQGAAKAWRTAVLGDAGAFARGLATRQLEVDGGAFVPLGRWQTPPFSPVRFDCQYVALQLPDGQNPCVWPGELTRGIWCTPQAAIEAHEAGQRLLAYPVLRTLHRIVASCNDVLAAAHCHQADISDVARHTHSLVPGVRVLPVASPTLPPHTHTNCYILGRQELVLVDPGTPYPEAQKELLEVVDGLVRQGAKVCAIWLTHAHPDHTGAAALARARYGAPIAGHRDCAAALDTSGDCRLDRHIQDAQMLHLAGDFCWQALHTPGHAPGHLCFYETKRRHLLAGDNVLGLGSSLVAPAPNGSMRAYMHSLKRLLRLDVSILLPGHGPPIATAKSSISRLIAHRQAREAKILAAVGDTPAAPAALLATAYADVKQAAWPVAQLSLEAHLEKLVEEKKIRAIDAGFVRC